MNRRCYIDLPRYARFLGCLLAMTAVLFVRARAVPAQIILLRHAEKPARDEIPHLSKRGQERAEALVGFFTTNPQVGTNLPIAALFAARPTRGSPSVRTRQTLAPLARHLKLPIQEPFPNEEYKALAKYLLASTDYDGRTVVVCWPHDELPQFAQALGASPKPKGWKGEVYDRAWVISFRGRDGRKVRCETVLQQLLPGDSGHSSPE